ncbi:MAG: type II toxin-antitoxin system VapC family toxin, partial [Gemmatimonadota bacterium]|nr:type II toxin-antitoxin system VapC family toxin [Gemmatimonadota bacterium]
LRAAGRMIAPNDFWIAASALAHGLTVVTGNVREFDRVPGLSV